jgi:hypothetical protein
MPKIVNSSSSTEKDNLEVLYSHNKGSPKVIKSHEDSENSNSKSKSSSKMSFWGSPDLSPVIEKLFNAMNLCENSRSLIISINLSSIKNMIHQRGIYSFLLSLSWEPQQGNRVLGLGMES